MPVSPLGTTTPRTLVTHGMVWIVASLLFVFGSWLIGQGAWIHIKAVAAQSLLHHAWEEMLDTHQPVKPWPWADTWPVGRLVVPRLRINQVILANASGQSLAFGPGKLEDGGFTNGDSDSLILSGHRDTHFSFIRDVQLGDAVTVQTLHGDWDRFVVKNIEVVDSRVDTLTRNQGGTTLRLITCYPFDALLPGGPLRYVVTASQIIARPVFQTEATASVGGGSKDRGMIREGG